nr:transposase [Bifidobacterium sp. SO1]
MVKNLYNACLYDHRQRFFDNEAKMITWQTQRVNFVHDDNPDYRALPAKIAGEVVQEVGRCFKSFFMLNRKRKAGKLPKQITRVRIPGYLDKQGEHTITFPRDTIAKHPVWRADLNLWEQTICPKDLDLHVYTRVRDVTMIRIQPVGAGYRIHVVYKEEPLPYEWVPDNGRYASIDLGVDNIMAVYVNDAKISPFIVKGGPFKAVNQWWNKIIAKDKTLQSDRYVFPNDRYKCIEQCRKENHNDNLTQDPRAYEWTKRMRKASLKRKHQMDWLIGNLTTTVANYLSSINISRVIVGWNADWKQNANMGRKTNQQFVQLPYRRILNLLTDKLNELGIPVTEVEESYTSQASFLDRDPIGVYGAHDNPSHYSGKRIKRGLYRSKNGTLINADVNGAGNIMRKAVPDSVVYAKGMEAHAVEPVNVRVLTLTKNEAGGFHSLGRKHSRSHTTRS